MNPEQYAALRMREYKHTRKIKVQSKKGKTYMHAVLRAYSLRFLGNSCDRIARMLSEELYPTKSGLITWHANVVWNLFRTEG